MKQREICIFQKTDPILAIADFAGWWGQVPPGSCQVWADHFQSHPKSKSGFRQKKSGCEKLPAVKVW